MEAKTKRPPTAAQTALQEKKALIRAELKESLKEHGIPYAIGMNAQAVKGWDIGLRGDDLMSFMLEVREQKAATTKAAAPATKRTPPSSIKPATKAAVPVYGATKKKTFQNKLNEINAIMAGISKPATKAAPANTKKNTRRAKLPRYYQKAAQRASNKGLNVFGPSQRHAQNTAKFATPSPNRGTWKKYEYRTRKAGPHKQSAKNAEIARLKGELARLRARCAKLNQTSYLASQMPSPPMGENNEALEMFLAESN